MSVIWVVLDHSVAGEPGRFSAVRKSALLLKDLRRACWAAGAGVLMGEQVYGPGRHCHRSVICCQCSVRFTKFTQTQRGERIRCGQCSKDHIERIVWIGVWKRFGEALNGR